MTVAIARFAQIAPTPWKNGLGLTTQLAVHPPDAAADAFEWRISIAEVTRSTRFSVFEGIERTIAVLQGAMTLVRANSAPIKLTPEAAPLRFPGDSAAEGIVDNGPVLDLNVMTRRPQWRARLRRLRLRGGAVVPMHAQRFLSVLEQHARIHLAGEGFDVERFDLVRVTAADELRVVSTHGLDAYTIDIEESHP